MAYTGQTMQRDAAEAIAARALAFLAADAAQLARFLALTGLQAADIRAQIDSAELLSAVLDHLVHDEPLLLVFAASAQVPPEDIGRALAALQETGRRPQRA
jgi:Protein of unknown function (DUF3572)